MRERERVRERESLCLIGRLEVWCLSLWCFCVGVVVCECVRVGEQEQERQGDCVSVCGWVFGLVVFVALVSNCCFGE